MRNEPVLGAVGISEFDEEVYRLLLGRPDEPLSAIAGTLGVNPSRVRNVVARLTRLGLLRRIAPGRYEPIGPETALTALVSRRRLETEAALDGVRAATADLARLFQTARLRDPVRWIEVLSGQETVNRRVDELTQSVRTHLWVLDRPPYMKQVAGIPDTNEAEIAETEDLIAKGVDIRSVYCPESLGRPGRFEVLVELAKAGEQARMLPELPFKLRIMDMRMALVSLTGGVYDNLALIHPSGLLDALVELFKAYWERATPLLGAQQPADDEPSDEDLLLLRMLKAGLKDEAIARQLGVSARTATRRIASVIDRLGATTRFQAGVEAATRGWL
ncbi:helix-turn-helix domain-containing protein [Micromonospora polyrhachis]|uniref:DNA-binding Lrp family transcriptional regulator n=1 Tax=Micromonospora polyrhachis TaxID=1282883 RepID=A0A7W7SUY6_9ACTN|nr:LuxR C-terminal-related transcriptional regulator [Micromonospora polyrhachis]MBB4961438.1 DNA-binding Lrp family transcriptional regulator [Micromonospora polyrhachis]